MHGTGLRQILCFTSRQGILPHPRPLLISVVVPKLEYAGEVWEGNAKLVK